MDKRVGETFFVELNSHQKHFGADGFVTKMLNLSTSEVQLIDTPVSEVMEEIAEPKSATVATSVAKGSKNIPISNSNLESGMVFTDTNGEMYFIYEINEDGIVLKFPLRQGIEVDTQLTQVGNTGIYKIEMTHNLTGSYALYFSNPSLNIATKGVQYRVTDINLNDVIDKVHDGFQSTLQSLASLGGQISNIGQEDFEVFSG